jgi:putative acetyltransferase
MLCSPKMAERSAVEITAATPQDLDAIRSLWREYWESLQLPPEFQGFADELRSLPGPYAAPSGILLLASVDAAPAGTGAMRPLGPTSCEAKRLYVRPEYRRKGIAKALLDRLVAEARAKGYSDMYADTLSTMSAALSMYRDTGFTQVGPYSSTPTPNAIFLKLSL